MLITYRLFNLWNLENFLKKTQNNTKILWQHIKEKTLFTVSIKQKNKTGKITKSDQNNDRNGKKKKKKITQTVTQTVFQDFSRTLRWFSKHINHLFFNILSQKSPFFHPIFVFFFTFFTFSYYLSLFCLYFVILRLFLVFICFFFISKSSFFIFFCLLFLSFFVSNLSFLFCFRLFCVFSPSFFCLKNHLFVVSLAVFNANECYIFA